MARYDTNLWTGTDGLKLTGVFPNLGTDVDFDGTKLTAGILHSVDSVADALGDSRKFLWGVLEQFYVAHTGGRNSAVTLYSDGTASQPLLKDVAFNGSGTGKTSKMTVNKSTLALVDEDTAKTTYTVVFNFAIGTPGGDTLEVEAE